MQQECRSVGRRLEARKIGGGQEAPVTPVKPPMFSDPLSDPRRS